MSLVAAKRTQCNASIEVNPAQEASVCTYCGTPFITEKAIANNSVIAGNVTAQVVNIYHVTSVPSQEVQTPPVPNVQSSSAAPPEAQQPSAAQQPVFALWSNGIYYPGYIAEDFGDHSRISFLDGTTSVVSKENIVELDFAFNNLVIQGNYGYGGIYYKAVVINRQPLTVRYTMDGIIEQVELVQLRGKVKKKGLFG